MTDQMAEALRGMAEHRAASWAVDWYVMTASNWRELLAGWQYDPHATADALILCPEHAGAGA